MRGNGLQALVRRSAVVQIGLVALLVVVAVGTFLSYRDGVRRADSVRQTLLALQALRGEVLSAETGLRGYTLSRQPSFLAPYRNAFGRIDEQERRLRGSLPPSALPRLASVERIVDDWRANFAEPTVGYVRRGRVAAAMRLTDTGAGKARIDRVRVLVAGLSATERTRLERVQDRLDRRGALAIVATIATFLLIVGANIVLRRRLHRKVIRPMTKLADAARAFGGGDLGRRIGARGGVREAAVAAEAFDAMAAQLEKTVLRLREVDELKSQFVASVSHELRTPLTSMSGFVGELMEPDGDPLTEDQREMLGIVERNVGHLEELIDDLLLLARLDAGQMRLELADVDIAELLRDVCTDLGPALRDRAIALEVDAGGRPVVAADRARLRQTFANLVGNAIKFSPREGRVAVCARSAGDGAVVEIRDEGPGIPPDELPHISERFFRASTAVGVKGTGLGLTISREIVELHGGSLDVRSTVGEGSTFRVHLPATGGR